MCVLALGCVWEVVCQDARGAGGDAFTKERRFWWNRHQQLLQPGLRGGAGHSTCRVARTGGCRTGGFLHRSPTLICSLFKWLTSNSNLRDRNQSYSRLRYFPLICRELQEYLSRKLATHWFPLQRANGIFLLNLQIFQKINLRRISTNPFNGMNQKPNVRLLKKTTAQSNDLRATPLC